MLSSPLNAVGNTQATPPPIQAQPAPNASNSQSSPTAPADVQDRVTLSSQVSGGDVDHDGDKS